MKIIVTGAAGLIGSHLVEQLVKKGAKVKAFHYYNSWDNLGWLHYLPKTILKEIELINGDIRDSYRVSQSFKKKASLAIINKIQNNADTLNTELKKLKGIETPFVPKNQTHAYYVYAIKINDNLLKLYKRSKIFFSNRRAVQL